MNKGTITQVIGPTLDLEFNSDSLPNIFNAITVKREDGTDLVAEVAQHVGNNNVRCVCMGSTDGLVRGMPVYDTGNPISVPVGWMRISTLTIQTTTETTATPGEADPHYWATKTALYRFPWCRIWI